MIGQVVAVPIMATWLFMCIDTYIYIYIRAGNLQIDVYIYDILMCCPDTQPGDIELRCVA